MARKERLPAAPKPIVRPHTLGLRVTSEEYKAIVNACIKADRYMADWLRFAVLNAAGLKADRRSA